MHKHFGLFDQYLHSHTHNSYYMVVYTVHVIQHETLTWVLYSCTVLKQPCNYWFIVFCVGQLAEKEAAVNKRRNLSTNLSMITDTQFSSLTCIYTFTILAWLTLALACIRISTTSVCPFWLAINSVVAPSCTEWEYIHTQQSVCSVYMSAFIQLFLSNQQFIQQTHIRHGDTHITNHPSIHTWLTWHCQIPSMTYVYAACVIFHPHGCTQPTYLMGMWPCTR